MENVRPDVTQRLIGLSGYLDVPISRRATIPMACAPSSPEWTRIAPQRAFGLAAWPEVGSRMTTRIATGLDMDGDWVVVQDGTYRYAADDAEDLRVRSIVW